MAKTTKCIKIWVGEDSNLRRLFLTIVNDKDWNYFRNCKAIYIYDYPDGSRRITASELSTTQEEFKKHKGKELKISL